MSGAEHGSLPPGPQGGSEATAAGASADAVPLVRLRGIVKSFGDLLVNDGVELSLLPGEVHALLGENGAGKTTLMSILFGHYVADEGSVEVTGKPLPPGDPRAALDAGVGMVHQHFTLAENMTVLENIALGTQSAWKPRLDRAAARRRIRQLSADFGLAVHPDATVSSLSVGERQRVEILKALYRDARILILDEPTAVLTPAETEALFRTLKLLVAQGLSIIFISHKLNEVRALTHRCVVLRHGKVAGRVDHPASTTSAEMAKLMCGHEIVPPARGASTPGAEVLTLAGISTSGHAGMALRDVSLSVRAGEVLGIAGVEGNGQAELTEALMGIRPVATGTIHLGTVDITGWSTRRRREAGIGFVPEDRIRQGLLLESPLWENRMLGHQTQPPNSRGPLIDRHAARVDTERIVAEYDVRTPSVDVLASALSGGNQQKLVVGREMSGNPTLLIASHPTRGVDVGAQAAIWDLIRAARREGLAVLLISADLDELIGLSDTISVILRGRFVATVDPHDVTPEQLGSAMTGAQDAA